jgi:hypothetical protein
MVYHADDEEDDETPVARARRPRARWSRAWIVLAIVLGGGAAGVLLLCCGSGLGLVWFGVNVISAEVEDQLRDNPHLQEEIGSLESIRMDITRSVAATDDDVMVFYVQGSQGAGTVTVKSKDDAAGNTIVQAATLRRADGTERELIPE